jgi:hypothetical protein
MRLRTAIKIQRFYEEPIDKKGKLRHRGLSWLYNTRQYLISRTICKRHWRDRRVPYIPSEEELKNLTEIQMCILADVVIEDENERETFKEHVLSELASTRK